MDIAKMYKMEVFNHKGEGFLPVVGYDGQISHYAPETDALIAHYREPFEGTVKDDPEDHVQGLEERYTKEVVNG